MLGPERRTRRASGLAVWSRSLGTLGFEASEADLRYAELVLGTSNASRSLEQLGRCFKSSDGELGRRMFKYEGVGSKGSSEP